MGGSFLFFGWRLCWGCDSLLLLSERSCFSFLAAGLFVNDAEKEYHEPTSQLYLRPPNVATISLFLCAGPWSWTDDRIHCRSAGTRSENQFGRRKTSNASNRHLHWVCHRTIIKTDMGSSGMLWVEIVNHLTGCMSSDWYRELVWTRPCQYNRSYPRLQE